jgi:uncharacterized iron-regulated membrane protein
MRTFRKLHRYFGLVIGIQFLFWTLGGIFFAWSNLDQIHGDFNRKPEPKFENMLGWKSPEKVYTEISKQHTIDSILSFKAIHILDEPHYQVLYLSNGKPLIAIASTHTGELRTPLTKKEAISVAIHRFKPKSEIKYVELITEQTVNKHHEYRNQPLPAYAITFAQKSGTTVYVSTEYGEALKFRNSNWRIFDFLWMMHTMDYTGRDNFGNILLRVFSIMGLVTIVTGFILYIKTSRYQKTLLDKKNFIF